jgi:hypothetical protein
MFDTGTEAMPPRAGNVEIGYNGFADSADYVLAETAPQAAGYGADTPAGGKTPQNVSDGRKLIKSANYNLESTEFDASVAALEALTAQFGGYVQDSSVSGGMSMYSSYQMKSAYYTLRVPSSDFDALLQSIGNVGNIVSKSSNTQDITDAYYDTETRVKTVKIKIERLTALLQDAENMENIIQLENALSDATYELESLTGTLKNFDRQVDYSVVTVYLQEVVKVSDPVKPPPVTLGERISNAFLNGYEGAVETVQNLIVWAAESLFGILLLALVVAAAICLVRRANLRRRKAPPAYFETPQSENSEAEKSADNEKEKQ